MRQITPKYPLTIIYTTVFGKLSSLQEFISMYASTDDIFTLTIIHTPLPAYPLHAVCIIPQKTYFYTFRQVYEYKLWVNNLANTDM